MTDEDRTTIEKAILHLAEVCDGAYKQDGQGFNKFDANFGLSLADQIQAGSTMTDGQLVGAYKMVKKYRRQLLTAGIDITELTELPTPTARIKNTGEKKITVKLNDNTIEVRFDGRPNYDDLEAIKALKERRWNPNANGKPWEIPARLGQLVIAIFEGRTDVEISAEVLELKDVLVVEAEPTAPVIVTHSNGDLLIMFPEANGRQERVGQLKNLPERQWMPKLEGKPWKVPTRLAPEVREMFPYAEFSKEATELITNMNELAAMSRKADGATIAVPGLTGELFPFQKVGVEFLERANGRAGIFDEMGLGKTIQAIAYMQLHPELRPVVVVVPASLKINWKREIEKWMTTNFKVEVLKGRTPYDLTGDILIINYDILTAWIAKLLEIKPALLIADEAHYAKNTTSQRAKALINLAEKIDKVILLTGTPVTNRPKELFPLLQMLDKNAWPNFFRYAKQYCDWDDDDWDFSGATNLEELHEIIKPYTVRRLKKEVLKDLPEKQRITVTMTFEGTARKEYEAIARELLKTTHHHLAEIEKMKQAAVRGKMNGAVEWIQNFLDAGRKLVVFTTHQWTVDKLMETFGDQAVQITGQVTKDARQNAIDKFQEDPDCRLLVGNIKAAGVGITLTAASDVAFIEFAWTPGDHIQAEDRCHRIGQNERVTAWYLVAENTIDESIVELIEVKRKIIETIHDGEITDHEFSILGELIQIIRATTKECVE